MPEGWRWLRLGELLRLEYGISLPERDRTPGDVPVIGSAGAVGIHDKATVEGPGIVVGRKGSIGSVTWVNGDFVPIDTTYVVVPTEGKADLRWIYHLLCDENLSRLNRATGVPGLNRDDVYAVRRVVPPLAEQRAIAAVLDSIDEAIERTEEVIAATESLRDSLLTQGVPGWHTEWKEVPGIGTIPADWRVVKLGDVCEPPQYGASAAAQPYNPDLPRFVRITVLTDDGRLSPDDPRSADPIQAAGYQLRDGDLLFARSGATVGKTYLYQEGDGPCVYAGYLIRFRPRPNELLSGYLELFTHAEPYHRWVASMFRAGTQPNINASEYASMHIPPPAVVEQKAIAGRRLWSR